MACAQNRILYDGFTLNSSHEVWLSAQLDRGILATITDESLDSHDKDFAASVKSHFASTMREAMRIVQKPAIKNAKPGKDSKGVKDKDDKGDQGDRDSSSRDCSSSGIDD